MPVSPTRDDALASLFQSAREGIYIGWLNPASPEGCGSVLAANPCLKRILGYPEEANEQTVFLFAPAHYADGCARGRLLEAVLAGTVNDYLVQLRRVDGAQVWVEVTAHTDSSDEGWVRVDALVRDVSERRQLDERARELHHQLRHSEQLAVIDRTLAEVAHELRNPLTTIVTWAERLALQTLDDKTHKGVSEILSAAERAARIVRNALHSSSRLASTRRMVDVNAIVRETVALRHHDQLAMNVAATVELGANVPAIFADAHQIQQVLLNIILNAEHAMETAHGRGTLSIRTLTDERKHVAIIEVSDDGPGVPEALRPRIFDRFFTTKQTRAGTGLGLAVAQALTHEHGGSIRLAPDRGQGATFVIELPTADLASTFS